MRQKPGRISISSRWFERCSGPSRVRNTELGICQLLTGSTAHVQKVILGYFRQNKMNAYARVLVRAVTTSEHSMNGRRLNESSH